MVSARLFPEIVRYDTGSVRSLTAADGERWLALHVRMNPPEDGASLNAPRLAVADTRGRSRPVAGIAGWDPQAPGPTFLFFADVAEPARIRFPLFRSASSGSGWGNTYTGRERTSVSYRRVQGDRWQGGFAVDKSGAVRVDHGPGPLDAVFLFAVPTGATRFTLKLDDRPLATATASVATARPGQALEEGCRGGRGQDCFTLSEAYQGGSGVPIDIARAVKLLARGCDAGSTQACLYLSGHLASGTGVPKDPARAFALIEKVCKQGHDEGCSTLGLRYLNGEGAPKDPARAIAILTAQCEAGGPLACNALGFIYGRVEPGVARDPARAVALYRRSCDAGVNEACLNLSKLHAPGGPDADLPGAAEAHRKACDLNDTWSCSTLGYRYIHGQGVPRDHLLAHAILVAPCEQQDGYACGQLGEIWWMGSPGITRTPETAAGYYRKACDFGYLPSCTNLGLMHLRGIAMPRDEAKGRALIQQACSGGYAGACRELESIR